VARAHCIHLNFKLFPNQTFNRRCAVNNVQDMHSFLCVCPFPRSTTAALLVRIPTSLSPALQVETAQRRTWNRTPNHSHSASCAAAHPVYGGDRSPTLARGAIFEARIHSAGSLDSFDRQRG
jgi:hypothetical protein